MIRKDIKPLLKNIREIGDPNTVMLIKELVYVSIDNLRIDNDVATTENVKENQGGIKALRELVSSITFTPAQKKGQYGY